MIPNFNGINNLFDTYNKMVGDISGDLFNVYRPNYTIQDNLPSQILTNVRYRMDPTGSERFVEPQFSNVEYYDIFGNRRIVQSGDIFFKGSSLSSPSLTVPAVTLLHINPVKAVVGMRTSKRCHIVVNKKSDGSYTYIYENVFFDFIQEGFVSGTINNGLMNSSSQDRPAQTAVMYFREGLVDEGLQLIETDNSGVPNGDKWLIQSVTNSGPVCVLKLVANYRR
jgi:hypothetical protein